jgi:hypothetical protein
MNDETNINTLIKRLSEPQLRKFALWCAERVHHLMTDSRSTNALDVAKRYLHGQATNEELDAAGSAARDAVLAAQVAMSAASFGAAPSERRAAANKALWAAQAAMMVTARKDLEMLAAVHYVAFDWAGCRVSEQAAQRAELERMLGEAKS